MPETIPDPYVGEIRMFAFSFAPANWLPCHGQIVPASVYPELAAVLGDAYGGTLANFALPDLRDRTPVHMGQGPGMTQRSRGETGGEEISVLTHAHLPRHSHPIQASNNDADATGGGRDPTDRFPARGAWDDGNDNGVVGLYTREAPDTLMNPLAMPLAGGADNHPNVMPCLTIGFCIAVFGRPSSADQEVVP